MITRDSDFYENKYMENFAINEHKQYKQSKISPYSKLLKPAKLTEYHFVRFYPKNPLS